MLSLEKYLFLVRFFFFDIKLYELFIYFELLIPFQTYHLQKFLSLSRLSFHLSMKSLLCKST